MRTLTITIGWIGLLWAGVTVALGHATTAGPNLVYPVLAQWRAATLYAYTLSADVIEAIVFGLKFR